MDTEKGMLYLCATPIGNLGDITQRVVNTLREVDIIAAEDTRNSIKLLNHFDIHTHMTSYHEYNKYDKADELIGDMLSGKSVALITDAGTPGISDPGEVLVKKCLDSGIRVTSLPGACACITALTMSGLCSRRFVFEGFLPADKKQRKQVLDNLKKEMRTIIIYEAPHHLKKTITELRDYLGNRNAAFVRELTKQYEETVRLRLDEAIDYYEVNPIRGEYVIVLEGINADEIKNSEIDEWMTLSIKEHVALYESRGYDSKDAMKMAAKDRGLTKRDIYKELINDKA